MNVNTNSIIAGAKDLPDLIAKAKADDPQLAAQLTTKAAVASSSLWGSGGAAVVSWVAAKYGFGWDSDTCALIAGVLAMAANAIIRRLTDPRVTGFFSKTPAPA